MKRPVSNISEKREVQEVLVSYLRNVKTDSISASANISEVKIHRILDSLEVLGFIIHIETIFAIQIKDEDVLARNFETVGSLTTFVMRKLAQRSDTEATGL